jgi:hypothetical protein
LLLPAFAPHAGVDDPAIVRVLTDHVDLRGRDTAAVGEANPGRTRPKDIRLTTTVPCPTRPMRSSPSRAAARSVRKPRFVDS